MAEPWEDPSTYAVAPGRRTNGFAVAGVLFGAIGGCLFGIVFGIIALVQVRRSGQPGRGAAILGIVLSCLWIAGIAYAGTHDDFLGPDRDSNGSVASGGTQLVTDLRVGDCVNGLEDQEEVSHLAAIPCARAHEAEVYAVLVLARTSYPGDEELSALAEDKCDRAFAELPDVPAHVWNDPELRFSWLQPFEPDWVGGDHRITCLVETGTARTGAFRQRTT